MKSEETVHSDPEAHRPVNDDTSNTVTITGEINTDAHAFGPPGGPGLENESDNSINPPPVIPEIKNTSDESPFAGNPFLQSVMMHVAENKENDHVRDSVELVIKHMQVAGYEAKESSYLESDGRTERMNNTSTFFIEALKKDDERFIRRFINLLDLNEMFGFVEGKIVDESILGKFWKCLLETHKVPELEQALLKHYRPNTDTYYEFYQYSLPHSINVCFFKTMLEKINNKDIFLDLLKLKQCKNKLLKLEDNNSNKKEVSEWFSLLIQHKVSIENDQLLDLLGADCHLFLPSLQETHIRQLLAGVTPKEGRRLEYYRYYDNSLERLWDIAQNIEEHKNNIRTYLKYIISEKVVPDISCDAIESKVLKQWIQLLIKCEVKIPDNLVKIIITGKDLELLFSGEEDRAALSAIVSRAFGEAIKSNSAELMERLIKYSHHIDFTSTDGEGEKLFNTVSDYFRRNNCRAFLITWIGNFCKQFGSHRTVPVSFDQCDTGAKIDFNISSLTSALVNNESDACQSLHEAGHRYMTSDLPVKVLSTPKVLDFGPPITLSENFLRDYANDIKEEKISHDESRNLLLIALNEADSRNHYLIIGQILELQTPIPSAQLVAAASMGVTKSIIYRSEFYNSAVCVEAIVKLRDKLSELRDKVWNEFLKKHPEIEDRLVRHFINSKPGLNKSEYWKKLMPERKLSLDDVIEHIKQSLPKNTSHTYALSASYPGDKFKSFTEDTPESNRISLFSEIVSNIPPEKLRETLLMDDPALEMRKTHDNGSVTFKM